MDNSPYYSSHAPRDDDYNLSHRALRERSSNARGDPYHQSTDPHQKPSLLSHPRPPSHASSSYSLGRRGVHDGHRDLASSHDSQGVYLHLFKLRQRCDAYQKYRQNQDKHVQNRASDGVWPDDVEEIFWKAIAAHPPMGREKVKLSPHSADTKAYGRNELIAKYMEHKLGKGFERLQYDSKTKKTKTPRKVVSSHIQVLKGKFKDSPALPDNRIVLYWLGKGEQKSKSARSRAANLHTQRRSTMANSLLEPRYFGMYLARDNATDEDCVHEFAEPGRHLIPHADAWVTEDSLQRDLPLLYPMWCERRLDCSVISAQTQINWRSEKPENEERQDASGRRRASLPSLHLSIQNQFQLRSSAIPSGCYSIVRYYFGNTFYVANGPHRVTHPDERAPSLVELRMGSQFWVNTFQILWKRVAEAKKEAMQRGDSIDVEEVVKATDAQNRQTIASITAVVEIYKDCSEDAEGRVTLSPCPMMVVHWTFRTTPPNAPGRTLWRNIVLPDQQQHSQDDDEDDEEMEHDFPSQQQEPVASSMATAYPAFDWSQTGVAPPMSHYDFEQTAAGASASFPWLQGESGMRSGNPMARPDGGFDLDLGNTFNFDDVPLDPGMMGDMDVSNMNVAMLASFSSAPPSNSQPAPVYNLSTSNSFAPCIQDHHSPATHPGAIHDAPVQQPFGTSENFYQRPGDTFQQSSNHGLGQQVSSLRSTQQPSQQQQHQQAWHRAAETGHMATHYQQRSLPEQIHKPASLDDGSSLVDRNQIQQQADPRRNHRSQPPLLSILPSQREDIHRSGPNSASTVSPREQDYALLSHGRPNRDRTPQSVAGQAPYALSVDTAYQFPHGHVDRPGLAQSQSFYTQQPHDKYDYFENNSEATTVPASVAGEQEIQRAYVEEISPLSSRFPMSQPQQHFANGDMHGFQILRSNDENRASGPGRDDDPKAHQRGLGLLFTPNSVGEPGFMDSMGHMKHGSKHDSMAEAGMHNLLPSPIDESLPRTQ